MSMTKEEITNITNELIEVGKLEEVLENLSSYVRGKDRYLENDLLLQTASFNRNQRDYSNGLISRSDYNISVSRLNYAITQIIERLPNDGNNTTKNTTKKIRKILFLSANPEGTGQLRLGEELRKIKDSLAASTEREQFRLESESAVQIPTITKAMQTQHPEVVHFSGHGTGEEGIVVEDSSGEPVLFPTNGLNRLFNRFKDTVKCVVLNACFSKEQAIAISNHGIYVVGMNKEIGDKAAIDFALGFYQSLGEGNDFEFAFDMALVNNSTNLNDVDTPELWINGEKVDI